MTHIEDLYPYLHKWKTSFQLKNVFPNASKLLSEAHKKNKLMRKRANKIAFKGKKPIGSSYAYKLKNKDNNET